MPIPGTQEIRKPLLEAFKGEAPRNFVISDFLELMAGCFGLNPNDLSSGDKNIFKSRINEAKIDLKKHNLLSNPSKNTYMITKAGIETLEEDPDTISDEYLAGKKAGKLPVAETFGLEAPDPVMPPPLTDTELEDLLPDGPESELEPETLPQEDTAPEDEPEELPDELPPESEDAEPEIAPEPEIPEEPVPEDMPEPETLPQEGTPLEDEPDGLPEDLLPPESEESEPEITTEPEIPEDPAPEQEPGDMAGPEPEPELTEEPEELPGAEDTAEHEEAPGTEAFLEPDDFQEEMTEPGAQDGLPPETAEPDEPPEMTEELPELTEETGEIETTGDFAGQESEDAPEEILEPEEEHTEDMADIHDTEDIQEDFTAEEPEYETEPEDDEAELARLAQEFTFTHRIEDVIARHNSDLADEILMKAAGLPSDRFEMLVIDLLSKMGYFAFQTARYTPESSGSGLIHGVILDNKTGANIYIQARKLSPGRTVGRADIQDFVEELADKGGKGIFATTASFSENAKIYANDERIMLIDGVKLANLMIANNFCVNVEKVFEVKAIDTDSFSEYEE